MAGILFASQVSSGLPTGAAATSFVWYSQLHFSTDRSHHGVWETAANVWTYDNPTPTPVSENFPEKPVLPICSPQQLPQLSRDTKRQTSNSRSHSSRFSPDLSPYWMKRPPDTACFLHCPIVFPLWENGNFLIKVGVESNSSSHQFLSPSAPLLFFHWSQESDQFSDLRSYKLVHGKPEFSIPRVTYLYPQASRPS